MSTISFLGKRDLNSFNEITEDAIYHLNQLIDENLTPTSFDEFYKIYVKDPEFYFEHRPFKPFGNTIEVSVLPRAAVHGNVELVKHIINIGKRNLFYIQKIYGDCELVAAAFCEDKKKAVSIAKELIQIGSKINEKKCNSSFGRIEPIATGPFDVWGRMVYHHPHPNDNRFEYIPFGKELYTKTPLWIAANITHNLELVELLLRNGAIEDTTDFNEDGNEIFKRAKANIKFIEFLASDEDNIKNNKPPFLPRELMEGIYQKYLEI